MAFRFDIMSADLDDAMRTLAEEQRKAWVEMTDYFKNTHEKSLRSQHEELSLIQKATFQDVRSVSCSC